MGNLRYRLSVLPVALVLCTTACAAKATKHVAAQAETPNGIWSVDVGGGNAHRLPIAGTSLGRGPGGRIAYYVGERLLVARDDGRGARFLGRFNPGTEDVVPASWASDGRSLAVGVGSGCDPTATCDRWAVWIVDARTGSKRRLVAGGGAPSWSPDGRQLVYQGAFANGGVRPAGPQKVFVVGADGHGARQIAHGELPVWQPHGSLIAYTSRRGVVVTGIRVVSATGGNDRPLGNGGTEFAWSPDGKRLAFVGPNPFENALYVVSAGGGQARRIGVAFGGAPGAVAWSPDGSRLAWVAYDVASDQSELMVARVAGHVAPRVVAHRPRGFSIGTPIFSADGARILYSAVR